MQNYGQETLKNDSLKDVGSGGIILKWLLAKQAVGIEVTQDEL
jgi:hypothetical protein